jgi:hypothetical protein
VPLLSRFHPANFSLSGGRWLPHHQVWPGHPLGVSDHRKDKKTVSSQQKIKAKAAGEKQPTVFI